MISKDTLVFKQKPDKAPPLRPGLFGFERGPADEITIGWLPCNGPSQSALQRRYRLIHVRAVQVHTCLKAQGIAGPKTAGDDTGG